MQLLLSDGFIIIMATSACFAPMFASSLLDCKTNTELYSNVNQLRKFIYPRSFQTDAQLQTENRQLSVSTHPSNNYNDGTTTAVATNDFEDDTAAANTNLINITVTGVPDGVSPLVDQALIKNDAARRLYVFSDRELDEDQLTLIDTFYGKRPYPNFRCNILTKTTRLNAYPKHNFVMRNEPTQNILELIDNGQIHPDEDITNPQVMVQIDNNDDENGCPTVSCSYVEYRYLQQRHLMANICFNPYTGDVYRLVLPERPLLCIIMPENFIRTGAKEGILSF